MGRGKTTAAKAGKAKAKTTAKGSGRGGAKASTPKKTAADLSDQQLQTLLFQYRRKLKPALLAKKNADDAVRKIYEQAKKEGVTKEELETAIKLETEEGQEKIGAKVARVMRVVRWVGADLGEQLDMFGKETATQRDHEDGRRAALDDQPRKPPSHLSKAGETRWFEGYDAGRAQLNEQRAEGFKPLADAAKGVVSAVPPPDEQAEREAA